MLVIFQKEQHPLQTNTPFFHSYLALFQLAQKMNNLELAIEVDHLRNSPMEGDYQFCICSKYIWFYQSAGENRD